MLKGTRVHIALWCLLLGLAEGRSHAAASDLELALGARSQASATRELEVEEAHRALQLAVAGTAVSFSVSPSLDLERDLDPVGDVEVETDVTVAAQLLYRHDARAIATARLVLTRAEARLRAQRRSDIERALLALSALRLALRVQDDARQAAAELPAQAAASDDAADRAVEIAARTAQLELRQAEEAVLEQRRALAELGILGPGALADVRFALPTAAPEAHPQAALLALQLVQARAGLRVAESAFFPTLAVTGRYEDMGFTTTGRLGLSAGRPEVALGVTYSPDDDRGWLVGVDATFRVRDVDVRSMAAAEAAVTAAERALDDFLTGYRDGESRSLAATEMAEEAFAIAWLTLELARRAAEDATAEDASEADSRRALQALRRADDAAERAWQRYVRTVADHLSVTEGDWRVLEAED